MFMVITVEMQLFKTPEMWNFNLVIDLIQFDF